MKKILVVTHERSGTHLLINMINIENKGAFYSIGFTNDENKFNVEDYKYQVEKDIKIGIYRDNVVFKSHHQIQFFENYLDFLFDNYYVIYLKRELKDVLLSYYRFLKNKCDNVFPTLENWIFMKPIDVGVKIMGYENFPDPHVIIQSDNYIERWNIHINGWKKYKDNILILDYENIINSYNETKDKIESYMHKKISNKIPDIKDKTLPNMSPNKGIIGSHKEFMSKELIEKIDSVNKLLLQ